MHNFRMEFASFCKQKQYSATGSAVHPIFAYIADYLSLSSLWPVFRRPTRYRESSEKPSQHLVHPWPRRRTTYGVGALGLAGGFPRVWRIQNFRKPQLVGFLRGQSTAEETPFPALDLRPRTSGPAESSIVLTWELKQLESKHLDINRTSWNMNLDWKRSFTIFMLQPIPVWLGFLAPVSQAGASPSALSAPAGAKPCCYQAFCWSLEMSGARTEILPDSSPTSGEACSILRMRRQKRAF